MRSCTSIVLVFIGSVCSAVAMGGSAIKQYLLADFNGSSDRILVDAADCRLVAGVAEWLYGEAFLDVRFEPADQRSSSFRPVIWRSVAELMAGILRYYYYYRDYVMANFWKISSLCWRTGFFPSLLMQFGDICHFRTASCNSQRIILCP